MSLLYMVGGAATFRVTYGTVDNSYTFKPLKCYGKTEHLPGPVRP